MRGCELGNPVVIGWHGRCRRGKSPRKPGTRSRDDPHGTYTTPSGRGSVDREERISPVPGLEGVQVPGKADRALAAAHRRDALEPAVVV